MVRSICAAALAGTLTETIAMSGYTANESVPPKRFTSSLTDEPPCVFVAAAAASANRAMPGDLKSYPAAGARYQNSIAAVAADGSGCAVTSAARDGAHTIAAAANAAANVRAIR